MASSVILDIEIFPTFECRSSKENQAASVNSMIKGLKYNFALASMLNHLVLQLLIMIMVNFVGDDRYDEQKKMAYRCRTKKMIEQIRDLQREEGERCKRADEHVIDCLILAELYNKYEIFSNIALEEYFEGVATESCVRTTWIMKPTKFLIWDKTFDDCANSAQISFQPLSGAKRINITIVRDETLCHDNINVSVVCYTFSNDEHHTLTSDRITMEMTGIDDITIAINDITNVNGVIIISDDGDAHTQASTFIKSDDKFVISEMNVVPSFLPSFL